MDNFWDKLWGQAEEKTFRRNLRTPNIDWEELIVKVNERFPFLANKEEMVETILDSFYQILPLPIRMVVSQEKFKALVLQNGDTLWKEYNKLKNR